MNNVPQQTLAQRSTAFALAAIVTLAVLSGIDALATHDVQANALLVQQHPVSASNG